MSDSDKFCRDLGLEVPENFTKVLYELNNKYLKIQIKYMELALNGPKESIVYSKILEAFQNKRALEFYEAFDLMSTTNSFIDCKHTAKNITSNEIFNRCDKCLRSWV
jgi:hypothetical protein